jgi:FCD domain
MPRPHQRATRVFTGAHQIAGRLLVRLRHPHRTQLAERSSLARRSASRIDLADNPVLSKIFRSLLVNLLMQRVVAGTDGLWAGEMAEEHAAIVTAYEEGDVLAAYEAIRRHNETSQRVAADAIARAGGAG